MCRCTLSLTWELDGGWVVNATPRQLCSKKRTCTYCIGGWVGPRAGLDGPGAHLLSWCLLTCAPRLNLSRRENSAWIILFFITPPTRKLWLIFLFPRFLSAAHSFNSVLILSLYLFLRWFACVISRVMKERTRNFGADLRMFQEWGKKQRTNSRKHKK